jgi:hypothetical protein
MRKTMRKYAKNVGNKTLNEREDDAEKTKKVKKVQDNKKKDKEYQMREENKETKMKRKW